MCEPLPQAVSLDRLDAALLPAVWPRPARPDESARAQADRLSAVAMQAKAVSRIEAQVRRERSFPRQVELNRDLRVAKQKLAELTDGT